MKTNLDKLFKTNDEYEKKGVWFELEDGVGFLIRPFKLSNPNIKSAMATLYKPYARQIHMGTLDDQKVVEINVKIFVQSCLVDWKGIVIDGKETPYDKDTAVKFFLELPDLFKMLWEHCQDYKNYLDDVGNFSAAT